MGKGDVKTKRGKLFRNSYGVRRPKKRQKIKKKALAKNPQANAPELQEKMVGINVEKTESDKKQAEKIEESKEKAESSEKKKEIYEKLNQAVTFEKFIHRKYPGQKRFSLEGGESIWVAMVGGSGPPVRIA